ncbi:MAG: AAA family ATPase, partial [Chthoniobacteraceae bacterium]
RQVAHALFRRIHAPRKDKPLGVFCFAGPPGVGKTLFAKVVNERLFGGNRDTFLHVDMAQFSQSFGASNLFGLPRGYAGSEQYGVLTGKLRDTPNCIILLDEFEKAHPDVHKRFLTAWNDGFITEGSDSAQISTRGAIFILTTNAASEQVSAIAGQHHGDTAEISRLLGAALREEGFAPEVVNRIDHLIAFVPIKGLDVARVAAREIMQLVEENCLQVAMNGIEAEVLLASVTRHEALGGTVRDIVRRIEDEITDGLIAARQAGASSIALHEEHGQVRVEVVASNPNPLLKQTP